MRGNKDEDAGASVMKHNAEEDMKRISHVVSGPLCTMRISFGRCKLIKIGRKWEVERKIEGTLFSYMMTEKQKRFGKVT